MSFEARPLRTARLLLRPLTADDLDDVFVYQSDAEVLRYMLWPVRDRAGAAEHLDRRTRMTRLAKDADPLSLGVETLDAPGRVIGEVNVRLTSVSDRQAEVGWVLNPAYQGRGYATEAAAALVDLCVDTVGSHRVHATLDPRNLASIGVCERLGMRKEAHFVQDAFFKGEWGDTCVYATLATEWRARRDAQSTESARA
ncbi:N-acetyltransferase [Frondihabitans sucicola]|uniref:N-acetyltransferase n=1 Tax=Frondihabitans sucicola TaxID=1268041 RepID=A0ABN6XUZ6_9MICO|nr:GNAT family protein [Frondihabitans sucicola]BDZ48778.1 N-acetyltransferase [Frondihabitans sucicola]